MANSYTSPNMSLSIPSVGIDPGPDWADNLNASLTILDQHSHLAGSGVLITSQAININADLPFNSNNLTTARSIRFFSQTSPLSGGGDLGCLYESGVDLYYNDGNGAQIRITQSGGVVGSPGSISGLVSPASATYVSGNSTFVWQSAASTPANLDAGSIILRNIVANSKGLTLNPPAAMSANYTLTLPQIPSVLSFLTIDTSGNISGTVSTSQGITNAMLSPGNVQIVTNNGGSVSSTTFQYTGISVTITTSGRPVWVGIKPYTVSVYDLGNQWTVSANDTAYLGLFYVGGAELSTNSNPDITGNGTSIIPPGFLYLDTSGAGTYTYGLYLKSNLGLMTTIGDLDLVAFEI